MIVLLLLCLTGWSAAQLLSTTGLRTLLQETGQTFPASEMPARLRLARKVQLSIRAHNSDPDRTFEMGLNQFSVMTDAEKDLYLGANANESSSYHPPPPPSTVSHPSTLPKEVDHVALGNVSPIRNQGGCGSCWAFGATGAMEGVYAVTEGRIREFADQEILDCSYGDDYDGCRGGWMDRGYNYVRSAGRFGYRSEIGYTAKDRPCSYSGKKNGILNIVMGANQYAKGDDNLATAVAKHPIAVAITVESDMFSYKSGIYNGCPAPKSIGHAVVLVGYTQQSWRFKNSWSTGWGEKGYCRVTRARPNVCHIADYGQWPNMQKRGSLWRVKSYEGRYLGQKDNFEDVRERRGAEGGWSGVNKFAYTLSGNPNNDALWEIGGTDTISMVNYHSGRYIFDIGSKPTGSEGGWSNAPRAKMIDNNYYGRWQWKKVSAGWGGYFLIQNAETNRYLFASGETVYTVDANYYNMALWTFEKVQ